MLEKCGCVFFLRRRVKDFDFLPTYLMNGPDKSSAVEAKIKELYSVLLQSGDEERIRDFQKFMLNKHKI